MADLELNSIGNGDGNNYLLRDNTKIPLSGSSQISGDLVPSTDNSVNLGDSTYGFASFYVNKLYLKGSTIFKLVDDSFICLGGATAQANGANIVLNGKDRSTSTGEFKLEARDGTNVNQLIGKPDGTLTWGNKNLAMQEDVVPRSGGFVLTDYMMGRATNNSNLDISGGNSLQSATLSLHAGERSSSPGYFYLHARTASRDTVLTGNPTGTLTWSGTAIQYTSDQRLKQQISNIDDKLLDAWEDVELSQFKYNDAVEEKGNTARLHTGYVVQQIDDACKSHNVDISKYGLYCHEEYEEETREVEHEDGTKTTEVVRPANEHYSLRYTEALIVECAYLRRENAKLKEQLQRHEDYLKLVEEHLHLINL